MWLCFSIKLLSKFFSSASKNLISKGEVAMALFIFICKLFLPPINKQNIFEGLFLLRIFLEYLQCCSYAVNNLTNLLLHKVPFFPLYRFVFVYYYYYYIFHEYYLNNLSSTINR
jgi:hypothetical protein